MESKMMKHPIAEANIHSPFGSLSSDEFYARHSVSHESEYITNSRGMKLFTQWWIPLPPTKIIGTLAVIHGYTSESSWFIQLTSVHLAKAGFATCAIDHQGHGYSEGQLSHIPDIHPVVEDCNAFFNSFREKYPASLPSFLYTESLGGAIGLFLNLDHKSSRPWDGIVMNSPMCGVGKMFRPFWPFNHMLAIYAWIVPTWQVPTWLILNSAVKEKWKRKLGWASPGRGLGRPTAATATMMLRVSEELQQRFEEVEVPFLIVQGKGDWLCDVACSQELYRRANSKDKTIRLYPGMWHDFVGEPQENVDLVFGEIGKWLTERAHRADVKVANKAP